MSKKKLTFFTMASEAFMKPIILALRSKFKVKAYIRGQQKEYYQLYGDTDVAWYEWCDNFTVGTINENKPTTTKHIVRFHSYELFTDLPFKLNWQKVDKLIFVSETVKNLAIQKFKIPKQICTVIQNGVNVDDFKIPENKKYNKKIVFIGYINYKKGPELLIQTFAALHRSDPDITFHIAGEHQDERIALYMNNIASKLPFKINFDGWVKDMPKYLEDKDFVISTSLFESFQYSLAEGMAQGCIPLIHSWMGADELYPKKYIFTTIDQAVRIFKEFHLLPEQDKAAARKAARDHIVKNFSFDDKIKQIEDVIESL